MHTNRIYIHELWLDVFDVCDENDLEYDMARNILPLPVGQRYGEEEMNYLVDKVIQLIID